MLILIRTENDISPAGTSGIIYYWEEDEQSLVTVFSGLLGLVDGQAVIIPVPSATNSENADQHQRCLY